MGTAWQHGTEASEAPAWWQWPNLLALDAALIAVIWQQWLSTNGLAGALVLGLSVWLTYTGDRWLDVRGLPNGCIATKRHRFARRWQKELLVVWLAVLAADIVLSLAGLTWEQFVTGLVMLVLCVIYTVAVHRHLRVPKEALVAFIFAAGTGLFPLEAAPSVPLLALLLCLFLLAFANCSLIAFRELAIDEKMGRTSLARQHPNSRPWAFYALLAAALVGLWLGLACSTQYLMVSVCAISLYALGASAERVSPELFRVLVDTTLLLPALCLLL